MAEMRKGYVLLRRQGRTPTKLSLSQIVVFKALWKLWLKKRVSRESSLASTAPELARQLGVPHDSVRAALNSLVDSGLVRKSHGFMGRTKALHSYVPLESGIELLALAEYVGEGSLLQVGKRAVDWLRLQQPPNVFDFATLYKGGQT